MFRRKQNKRIVVAAALFVATTLVTFGVLASSGAAISIRRVDGAAHAAPAAPSAPSPQPPLSHSSPASSVAAPVAAASRVNAVPDAPAQNHPGRRRRATLMTPQLAAQIVATARAHDLDPFLVLEVMRQESAFNPRATSFKDGRPCARGLMQMIQGTAGRFGVTDPYDPQQAITGGCRYLVFQMQRFGGRLDLVLAGYNAGEGAVERYGRRVPPFAETQNYVRSILLAYRRARAVAESERGQQSRESAERTAAARDLRQQLASLQRTPAMGVEQ